MTLEQLKQMSQNFVQAVKDYKDSADFNSVELEFVLDNLLCRLPRDIVYVEWFDRSDIKMMADGQLNNEEADDDLVDNCMKNLDRFNGNIMENDTVQDIVCDTVRQTKGA